MAPVVPVDRRRAHSPRGKRALDLALAAILLVVVSPILLVAAILVRATSRGPVLFRQIRIGEKGEPFTLYKFRTMYVDTPAYARTPSNDDVDPRVTQLGRFLRPTSVDELPQLFNVLKGDMSLVGPRPEMPFIVDTYTREQRKRLAAKPGLTGLWQIGPTRWEPIHEHMEYDLAYIAHASVLLDVQIIARTVSVVICDTLAAAGRLWVRVTSGAAARERARALAVVSLKLPVAPRLVVTPEPAPVPEPIAVGSLAAPVVIAHD